MSHVDVIIFGNEDVELKLGAAAGNHGKRTGVPGRLETRRTGIGLGVQWRTELRYGDNDKQSEKA